jgi:hypothetical protein
MGGSKWYGSSKGIVLYRLVKVKCGEGKVTPCVVVTFRDVLCCGVASGWVM